MPTGAPSEGCVYIAEADEAAAARLEVTSLVTDLLPGLRRHAG